MPAVRARYRYVCLPTLDAEPPGESETFAALAALQSGATDLHCAQGRGRSALFALLLLARQGAVADLDSGLAELQRVRPRVRLCASQRRFAEAMLERLKAAPQAG